jgi:hypothetical protein
MTDPMTSPSQEVKPLPCPFCGATPEIWPNADDTLGMGCINPDCDVIPALTGRDRNAMAAIWNRRELESRVSPGVAPAKSLDQIKQSIAYTVDRHTGGSLSEAVIEPLVDELAAQLRASRSSGEDQTAAAERIADDGRSIDALNKALNTARAELDELRVLYESRRMSVNAAIDDAGAEIAALKQQVIDSALRAERLEADLTALAEGKVWKRENIQVWRVKYQPGVYDTADEALAAYRASLSPQPAPPAHACLNPATCDYASRGWCPACEPVSAQPAEPTGATLGFAKLVREELAMNPHNDDDGHLRCTCDECCAALLAELWEKPLTIQPKMVIYTPGMNADTLSAPNRVASHPAEPERGTTRTLRDLLVADPTIPLDELHVRIDGRTVARIQNLGPNEDIRLAVAAHSLTPSEETP